MARQRTVSPKFFTHDGLFEAEASSGLPVRLAYAGLWGQADRRGVFEWRPLQLKLAILPFDSVDFGAVLNALEAAGFIHSYEADGRRYGFIPSLGRWQNFNSLEKPSKDPGPPDRLLSTSPASARRRARTVPEPSSHHAEMMSAPTSDGVSTADTDTDADTDTGRTEGPALSGQLFGDIAPEPHHADCAMSPPGSAAEPRPAASHSTRPPAPTVPAVVSDPPRSGERVIGVDVADAPWVPPDTADWEPGEIARLNGPPLDRDDAKWRIDVLYERWRYLIGEIDYGHFRKRMAAPAKERPIADLWHAIDVLREGRLYRDDDERRWLNFQHFVAELPTFVRLGALPMYDGKLAPTERGWYGPHYTKTRR